MTVRDGVGSFEIEDFWGQTVTLPAGPKQVRLNVEKDRLDDIVIDLQPRAQRLGRTAISDARRAPRRSQALSESTTSPARVRTAEYGVTPKWLDIQDGQARCEIPVPAEFTYGIDLPARQAAGGLLVRCDLLPIDIPPGDRPIRDRRSGLSRPGRSTAESSDPTAVSHQTPRATLMIVKKPDIEGGQAAPLSGLGDALGGWRGSRDIQRHAPAVGRRIRGRRLRG